MFPVLITPRSLLAKRPHQLSTGYVTCCCYCVYCHCCCCCSQLLFPGGAREVNKKVGQEYQLFWKESPDFVRLAARCEAIIVPFAAVGADDAYDGKSDLTGAIGTVHAVDGALLLAQYISCAFGRL